MGRDIACMGVIKNADRILVGKPEGKTPHTHKT
jgi:hypothetical protein